MTILPLIVHKSAYFGIFYMPKSADLGTLFHAEISILRYEICAYLFLKEFSCLKLLYARAVVRYHGRRTARWKAGFACRNQLISALLKSAVISEIRQFRRNNLDKIKYVDMGNMRHKSYFNALYMYAGASLGRFYSGVARISICRQDVK